MQRFLVVSALFALAVLATSANGQPPKPDSQPKPDYQPKGLPDKMPEKKMDKKIDPVDSTDAAIASALANDPDVKMARAKIQLAEAELAKARLTVTQKVFAAQSAVQEAKVVVLVAQQDTENVLAALNAEKVPNATSHPTYRLALTKLEGAKAKFARAETELKLITGGSVLAVNTGDPDAVAAATAALLTRHRTILEYVKARDAFVIKGPIPDRIRTALDKPVKLGAKGEKVTFQKALAVFKQEAGLDVPVRPMPSPDPMIVSEGEELPVGAWFQLYQDTAGQQNTGFAFYVREYGLLVANKQTAPPDAPTLTEFWKQKAPAAKAEEPK